MTAAMVEYAVVAVVFVLLVAVGYVVAKTCPHCNSLNTKRHDIGKWSYSKCRRCRRTW